MESSDLVIVGGGIIGLAHAFRAVERGLRVQLIERDHRPRGASVRNFGHACVTAQVDDLADVALDSRTGWLTAARQVGFWASEAGCLVVGRSEAEIAILEEFATTRGRDEVHLLTRNELTDRMGTPHADPRVLGGAFLPLDLRVDPRTAAPDLADHLAAHPAVDVHWGTTAHHIETGAVHTSRGTFRGDQVLACVGHDLDRLYPDDAEHHQVQRCLLQMALVTAPTGYRTDAAVLTGTSMLRYAGLAATRAADTVRQEIAAHSPELLAMDANVMFTRRPDGTLIVGDSHVRSQDADPFTDEDVTDRLLAEIATIVGVDAWRVRQRWQGVYAHSPITDLLRTRPLPGVATVTVTTGIGMTLAFGIASATLDAL